MLEGTVSPYVTRLLLGVARTIGVREEELARIPALDAVDRNGIRLPTGTLNRLWAASAADLKPWGTPIRVMEHWSPGRFNIWDYLFTTAGTLSQAFEIAGRHIAVLSDPADVVEVTTDQAERLTVTFRPGPWKDVPEAPMIYEFALGIALGQARAATGQTIVPVGIELPHRAPAVHTSQVEAFGTRAIDFGADRIAITFSAADAATPLPGDDPVLSTILQQHAKTAIATARPILGWLDKLHAEIATAFPTGTPTLGYIAHRLAMSPRTLQRRLHAEGTAWRTELERVRADEAARLLRETDLGIDSIATRVGYTDIRALRRTFHRLHGQPPSQFRQAGPA